MTNSQSAFVSGYIDFQKVQLATAPFTPTEITVAWAGAPSGLTSGQNWAGIYDLNGNLIASSADLSTLSSANRVTIPVTATSSTNGPYVEVAFLWNGTTVPSNPSGVQTVFNGYGSLATTYPRRRTKTTYTTLPSTIDLSDSNLNPVGYGENILWVQVN